MAPILDPQGQVREIPDNMVPAAIKAGGKTVTRVQAPDKTLRWIPDEHLGDAQKAGGLVIPAFKEKALTPESSTTDKILGELGNDSLSQEGAQNFDKRKGEEGLGGGLNSFEGSVADPGKSASNAAVAGTGVAALGTAGAAPAVFRTLAAAAEAHPVVAKLLLHGLEAVGLGAGIKGAEKLLK